jgi:hypothetical protein
VASFIDANDNIQRSEIQAACRHIPVQHARHITAPVSRGDRELWDLFLTNPEVIAAARTEADARLIGLPRA